MYFYKKEVVRISSTLIIVSGPSGVGKTTIIHAMCDRFSNFREAVACTTRSPRAGEVEGRDYYFLDDETFASFMAADKFFISETYDNHKYGILKSELTKDDGFMFLNIGIPSMKLIPPSIRNGAITIYMMPSNLSDLKRWMLNIGIPSMKLIPPSIRNGAITIYMMPSNLSDLKRWMQDRGDGRLKAAKNERFEAIKNFEYIVINRDGKLEASITQVLTILHGDPPIHARIENNICFLEHFYDEKE